MLSPGKILSVFGAMFTCTLLLCACDQKAENIVVKPIEIDSTLLNPGRGFTSTGQTFNENLAGRLHPVSGISQQRFYWDQLEPEEGKINFALIDSIIDKCIRNGQQLNLRVMCQNIEMKVPEWAMKAGVKSPFYDNPVFLEKHINFIKALGARYDGNPVVCFVDIGTVGHWGEWHIDADKNDPGKYVYPTDSSVKKIVDAYFSSFKKTPLVSLISLKKKYGFQYATSNGAGWRADCWGDMDSLGWNHMKGVYPQAIDNAGAHESWKNGPIAFETCWTMNEWYKRGWDLDYILNKALEWHATGVNNGTEAIPEAWYPKVKEFEKKLGYRFVLTEFNYPATAKTGGALIFTSSWQNKGVAPVYKPFQLAIRLVSRSGAGQQFVIPTDADLKKLVPGTAKLQSSPILSGDIQPGEYDMELGIVAPGTKTPAIRLAIAGKTADGWYKMGAISITN